MLQRHPDAFTSSYEEDVVKPLSWAEQRLAPGAAAPFDFVLGGFSDTPFASLVGAVGLNVEPRVKQRHKGFLFGMYVAPEFEGRGMGRALLEACIERARRIDGLEQINLTVTATNDRAKRLYEAAGFKVFGIEEHAIKVGDRYYAKAHMVLRLVGRLAEGGIQ
jgi:ribosomal protein S18 acetylase RimI-like enzyme